MGMSVLAFSTMLIIAGSALRRGNREARGVGCDARGAAIVFTFRQRSTIPREFGWQLRWRANWPISKAREWRRKALWPHQGGSVQAPVSAPWRF